MSPGLALSLLIVAILVLIGVACIAVVWDGPEPEGGTVSDLKRILAMAAGLLVTFGAMFGVWQTNGSTIRVAVIGLLGAWVTSPARDA